MQSESRRAKEGHRTCRSRWTTGKRGGGMLWGYSRKRLACLWLLITQGFGDQHEECTFGDGESDGKRYDGWRTGRQAAAVLFRYYGGWRKARADCGRAAERCGA